MPGATVNTRTVTADKRPVADAGRTTPERRFFAFAGAVMLAATAVGFQEFYLHLREFGGTEIPASRFLLVIGHGAASTAWIVLFLVQAVLIASRRRQIHMTLGWSAIALAVAVVISGVLVAVKAVEADPLSPFFGMQFRQFLLVMLAEFGCFASFVAAGVLNRKRPVRHRAMMLLATLSLMAAATIRMPILLPVFGETGWIGIFGPAFVLGGLLVIGRSIMLRAVDRWLTAGFAVMVLTYVAAATLATGDSWSRLAHWAFEV
jgi:hypothetical protein